MTSTAALGQVVAIPVARSRTIPALIWRDGETDPKQSSAHDYLEEIVSDMDVVNKISVNGKFIGTLSSMGASQFA